MFFIHLFFYFLHDIQFAIRINSAAFLSLHIFQCLFFQKGISVQLQISSSNCTFTYSYDVSVQIKCLFCIPKPPGSHQKLLKLVQREKKRKIVKYLWISWSSIAAPVLKAHFPATVEFLKRLAGPVEFLNDDPSKRACLFFWQAESLFSFFSFWNCLSSLGGREGHSHLSVFQPQGF